MKGQRWKTRVVEGRGGEGGRECCEKWCGLKAIYREGMVA